MKEIWKPVLGHELEYEVSNLGNVRSKDRIIEQASGKQGNKKYKYNKKGKLLRPGRCTGGHVSVAIGRRNSRLVHHLVLEAFVGLRPEGTECLHKNGNPKDNRLENLHWGSRAQNIRDKKWHGTPHKLSIPQIKDIKKSLKNNESPTLIARKHSVSLSTIWGIRYGKLHNDV